MPNAICCMLYAIFQIPNSKFLMPNAKCHMPNAICNMLYDSRLPAIWKCCQQSGSAANYQAVQLSIWQCNKLSSPTTIVVSLHLLLVKTIVSIFIKSPINYSLVFKCNITYVFISSAKELNTVTQSVNLKKLKI